MEEKGGTLFTRLKKEKTGPWDQTPTPKKKEAPPTDAS